MKNADDSYHEYYNNPLPRVILFHGHFCVLCYPIISCQVLLAWNRVLVVTDDESICIDPTGVFKADVESWN